MSPTAMLLAALVLISVAFCAFWAVAVRARRPIGPASPGLVRAGSCPVDGLRGAGWAGT